MSDPYAPGTFVKDGKTVVADTAADAVALIFDGAKRVAEAKPEAEKVEVEQPKGEPVDAPAVPGQSRSFSNPPKP